MHERTNRTGGSGRFSFLGYNSHVVADIEALGRKNLHYMKTKRQSCFVKVI